MWMCRQRRTRSTRRILLPIPPPWSHPSNMQPEPEPHPSPSSAKHTLLPQPPLPQSIATIPQPQPTPPHPLPLFPPLPHLPQASLPHHAALTSADGHRLLRIRHPPARAPCRTPRACSIPNATAALPRAAATALPDAGLLGFDAWMPLPPTRRSRLLAELLYVWRRLP